MSKIEWTEQTWNPVVGCTPVSPGCLNCYAATMARRLDGMERARRQPDGTQNGRKAKPARPARQGYPATPAEHYVGLTVQRGGRAVFAGEVRCLPQRLTEPLHWRKGRMVFVNSMSDLFHEAVPFDFIDQVFAVMALCPQHTFQVLTKRPARMAEYLGLDRHASAGRHGAVLGAAQFQIETGDDRPRHEWTWPLPNVWLGTSVENQAAADERIPQLLKCPAAVRFLSCEPLLGPVNIGLAMCTCPWPSDAMATRHLLDCPADTRRPEDQRRWAHLHWVIAGGESGPGARPCDVAWIRSIVKQCRAAGVPVFVKQLGARFYDAPNGIAGRSLDIPTEGMALLSYRLSNRKGGDPAEWPDDLRVREWPREHRRDACATPATTCTPAKDR